MNASGRSSPLPQTVPELLAHAAKAHDARDFIVDGDETLSFAELHRKARTAARALMAQDIAVGDRVAIWAPNVWEWIVAALGIQMAGAVLVPLNTRYKGAEGAWILNTAYARTLFTVSGFLDIDYIGMLEDCELPSRMPIVCLRGTHDKALSFDDFMATADEVTDEALDTRMATIDYDTQLDMLFTSGTTGKPKGVDTGHGQNIKVYDTWSRTVGLTQEDRYLIINPFFHAFGYKAGWLSALIRGCTIYPMSSFDIAQALEYIQKYRISMLPGPPAIYQSMLMHPDWKSFDISSLRLAVTGAASVPVDLIKRIRSDLGFESVVTAYGLTESCGTVTICRAGDSAERVATTAGCAMPGVEVRCVDTEGNTLPANEPGELLVRGYNVMRRYCDNPEATAETLDADGWLHTGDIAVMDKDGYIRITDRIKDVYISGGFNCYPAEIENALCDMEGVMQAAVIGVPDERLGEVGCAYVVAASDTVLNEKDVIAWCKERMANFKVPRVVRMVKELPLNAAGKVLKTQLRERERAAQGDKA